jgi:acyl-homoserine lactone acylase PvdQ
MLMTSLFLTLAAAAALQTPSSATPQEVARWERRAQNVTIIRDDWGIPHVYGKTDADVVFGVLYAQAEDDFNRVETNYINAMGRLAEAEGETALYQDLRMKLFIHPDSMREHYEASPEWLRHLMDAFADGLNFFLYKHPEVKPRVITRFEPWMALTFSEGSIGGDIERISVRQLEAFYGRGPGGSVGSRDEDEAREPEPGGSNGIAIAAANTLERHPLLLINPHTSFFFRAEVQMVSEEGLNAYGAVTWGQFFVYQGFNDRLGWMHTSSGVDNIDEYLETVTQQDGRYVYRYGTEDRPLLVDTIVVPYKTATGMSRRTFTVYRTHHGPIVRRVDGKWVSVQLMQDPMNALIQSYTRTKARNFLDFRRIMEVHTNSSNNTVYADADGYIAYFHANFIPRRDTTFDWTRPVDGSNPATEWQGLLSVDESPNVVNPQSGWVFNTNNHPWSAAGPHSPQRGDYPKYVQTTGENARGLHALRVLEGKKDFTIASLIAAAYDTYLPYFDKLIPALLDAYERTPAATPLRARVREQIALLRAWDRRWSATSVPTTLAIAWADELQRRINSTDVLASGLSQDEYLARNTSSTQHLQALATAADTLTARYGTWRTPWGDVNRFQRLTGDIVQQFNDARPSIAVPFTAGTWGSLASFAARTYPGTKKRYGTSGNSFVAVVEFGDSVVARAVTAGGQSGNPRSRHFNDQAERYAAGNLRDVYFYRWQLVGHTEREYQPGY